MDNSLEVKANWVREQVVKMCRGAHVGHVASSLSCVEILISLYYCDVLQHDPERPNWEDRDYFIMSKGHGVVALYPILADRGFFPLKTLDEFCTGGQLGSHPDVAMPGVDLSTGSLGHGLGVGIGLAYGLRRDNKANRVFVLMGDSECQEGTVWEAIMCAGHYRLNNLIAIVDRNFIGALGQTERYLKLEPLHDKLLGFGWNVLTVNGHSLVELGYAFHTQSSFLPKMIIAHTVKGKGVPALENNPMGHTLIP